MSDFSFRPLTPDKFDDLVDLFGPERGASGGCWCMWWRVPTKTFNEMAREERRAAFEAAVGEGPTGVLAYDGDTAIGWCAVGPRSSLPKLNRSRVAATLDDPDGVWMINCFFVRKAYRGDGLMGRLIAAAVDYARGEGARALEACPVDPQRELQWGEGFIGIASQFAAAGFAEVARRSPTRPLMRLDF
ncbi:GNAT family N-acetyltransferase [Rhodobium gokarnense]|uniref:GNAT superfamily N-acetyltransferase n=1 Tax=Rhodobium gokarnense TaxID=364296 RepID=A0ABT3HA09_9HYPH|nr:GNAT family N-acetyltransferase [Rhodobium gokarnense]MCW2307224.1 GNAT superfamily N-acetyltransferase [Rhodobium gokarnense]